MDGEPYLRVELKNERPVELADLTAALMALGQAFEDFAASRGYDPIRGNARLYIRELKSGSIIADLQAILDQASFFLEQGEVFAGFLANLNDVTQWFLVGRPSKTDPEAPSRIDAERLAQIIEPVAKDGGAQLILQVQGDVNKHEHFHITSLAANTVQNNVGKYFGPLLPAVGSFQMEALLLSQLRDDPRSKSGDRGVIEKYSSKPVRLHFMNEEAKARVLSLEENPFNCVFIVDGEVSTADGKPVVYKIHYVHESIDRSETG